MVGKPALQADTFTSSSSTQWVTSKTQRNGARLETQPLEATLVQFESTLHSQALKQLKALEQVQLVRYVGGLLDSLKEENPALSDGHIYQLRFCQVFEQSENLKKLGQDIMARHAPTLPAYSLEASQKLTLISTEIKRRS
jgi:hypothetical protein